MTWHATNEGEKKGRTKEVEGDWSCWKKCSLLETPLSLSLFVLLFFSRLPLSHFRKSSHVQLQPWQKAQNCNPMVSGFCSVSCLVGAFFGSGGGCKLSGSGEWEERAGEWCC